MIQRLLAVFRNGVFCPSTPCIFPENAEVELEVKSRGILPPAITDPRERELTLARLRARILDNPLPALTPHFTRDELHERG